MRPSPPLFAPCTPEDDDRLPSPIASSRIIRRANLRARGRMRVIPPPPLRACLSLFPRMPVPSTAFRRLDASFAFGSPALRELEGRTRLRSSSRTNGTAASSCSRAGEERSGSSARGVHRFTKAFSCWTLRQAHGRRRGGNAPAKKSPPQTQTLRRACGGAPQACRISLHAPSPWVVGGAWARWVD